MQSSSLKIHFRVMIRRCNGTRCKCRKASPTGKKIPARHLCCAKSPLLFQWSLPAMKHTRHCRSKIRQSATTIPARQSPRYRRKGTMRKQFPGRYCPLRCIGKRRSKKYRSYAGIKTRKPPRITNRRQHQKKRIARHSRQSRNTKIHSYFRRFKDARIPARPYTQLHR